MGLIKGLNISQISTKVLNMLKMCHQIPKLSSQTSWFEKAETRIRYKAYAQMNN